MFLALSFGILLIVITPPFQSPDEAYHFQRAFQISQGEWVARQKTENGWGGGVIPISVYQIANYFSNLPFQVSAKASFRTVRAVMRIPLRAEEKTFVAFANTSHYCPVAYLPQCVGIAVGKILDLPPLAILYLSRLTNLFAWTLLGVLSLKAAPSIARPFFLLLLMPMSLSLAASVSADAPTNALALLFTALICRQFTAPSCSLHRKSLLLLALVAVPLSLSKLAYCSLSGIMLIVPTRVFGGRIPFVAKCAVFIAVNVLACFAWISISGAGVDTPIRMENDQGVVPRSQLEYVRQHPFRFPVILWATAREKCPIVLQSFVGEIGAFDKHLPTPVVVAFFILLAFACWSSDKRGFPPPMKCAAIVLPAISICILLIAFLDYLYWTRVGANTVDGFQGRYLIPLAPALIVLCFSVLGRLPAPTVSPARLDFYARLASLMFAAVFCAEEFIRFFVAC